MDFIRICLMISAAVLATGANIEILTDNNSVKCGTNYTLTCKIEEYSFIVTWMFENFAIPIAKCLRNACNLNPDYVEKYQFTYDMEQGVYNLTIINVTISDIGRKFLCSNGYDSVSETVSFNVTEYKAMLFEETEKEVIIATSGCIFPDTNVIIKWIKIDSLDDLESEFYPQLIHTSAKICSNVSVCSTNQHIQHLVVISAKPSGNGKYYLKMTVAYENKIIESSITTLKYNIEEMYFNSSAGSDDRKIDKSVHVLLLVENIILLIGVAVSVICYKVRARKASRTSMDSCAKMPRYMYRNVPLMHSIQRRGFGQRCHIHEKRRFLTSAVARKASQTSMDSCAKMPRYMYRNVPLMHSIQNTEEYIPTFHTNSI